MAETGFEWDPAKDLLNQEKHGVSFDEAKYAFADPHLVILEDLTHDRSEPRYYCIGSVERGILTIRFTYRAEVIRIFGAGFWRKGRAIYERQSQIHE